MPSLPPVQPYSLTPQGQGSGAGSGGRKKEAKKWRRLSVALCHSLSLSLCPRGKKKENVYEMFVPNLVPRSNVLLHCDNNGGDAAMRCEDIEWKEKRRRGEKGEEGHEEVPSSKWEKRERSEQMKKVD